MPKNKLQIILASQSLARKGILEGAGLKFSIQPADIDEDGITATLKEQGFSTRHIALDLSEKKAQAVAAKNPDALVIGCDQVLELEGKALSKAKDKESAKKKLRLLSGKTHNLISAVSIVQGQTTFWQHEDEAQLTMHAFNEEFLESYVQRAGPALTRAVGAYEIESAGAWLFSEVRGDYFTILGLPLLPLLSYLHDYHGCRP
jgi:septum formation protein